VALAAEELDTTGHQSSTVSNGQQISSAMVSFRQDQNTREFQKSLSARKLAANVNKSIGSAAANGKDAAPAFKQRMDEKDQLIKVLNEYIEKLKSELSTSRSQHAGVNTLDMPLSTSQHHRATAAIRSQKSTETVEPNARRNLEQTARSALVGSFRAAAMPEYAENDYIHTSMDDRESCGVSDGGRAFKEADKHEEYYHQIYQLTQQVQRLAGQLRGPDPT
jgi:seryl-tRNA synthetase